MQCLIDYFSQENHPLSVDNDPMEQMIGPYQKRKQAFLVPVSICLIKTSLRLFA